MELRRIDTFLFKSIYLIEAAIFITQMLNYDSLTSLLFYLTFPLTGLLWLRSVRKTVTGTDVLMLSAVVLAIVSVFLSTALAGGSIGFSYLKKLIMFIMSLLFLQTVCKIHADQDLVRFVNRIVDLLTVSVIAMFFFKTSEMYSINGRITRYLVFNLSNPNFTAQFLLIFFMLEFYRLFTREKWYRKLMHITMAVFLAFFVFETRSRNAQLVLLAYTMMCVWLIFQRDGRLHLGKWASGLIAFFPALFAAAYMYLISADWLHRLFSFLVEEGKGLDSRTKVWGRALDYIVQSPLMGSYYQIYRDTGGAQMHNTHLEMAASYGLVVLVLVCVLIAGYIYRSGRKHMTKQGMSYLLGFCGSVMMGMGEAAVFSGGLGIYIFAGAFLLMANASEVDVWQVPEKQIREL